MRSEYSKWFWSECDELNKDTSFAHSLAEKAWNYRQTEVDELQKQRDSFIKAYEIEMDKSVELQKNNAWLSGVACRENKRANKLQEEKVSTTTLLGKTIQEKNDLQKRVDESLRILADIKKKGLIGSQYSIFDLEQALKGDQ